VSNSCYIGNIAGQTVGMGGSTCYVDNDGKLGVFLSARRFKTDIADMGAGSEALLALRPVTFHYKPELDKTGIAQFGLVAEDVAKVNPDLVTRDRDGKLQTVRYEAVNVMLLNEFLKEHCKVKEQACEIQEQRATIYELSSAVAQQQEEMKAFAATLKEQASQIQKVSAQVEVSRAVQPVARISK
jgi:trimeric autotransporter adhesin